MKTRLSLVLAVSSLMLAGCDDSPTGPSFQCTLSTSPSLAISGDTVTTSTGLKYIEVEAGSGTEAQLNRLVTACYVGFFPNGPVFDAGTLEFSVGEGRLIAGFEQGVVGMREGGRRRLIIPPSLGYGSRAVTNPNTGQVVIPANSTLVFDIGLLDVGGR